MSALLWTEDFFRTINPLTIYIGFDKAEPGWVSERKNIRQTDFDIWYIVHGSGSVKIDGYWHDFTGGEIITIRPGSLYQQEKASTSHPVHAYYTHVLPFGPGHQEYMKALGELWPLRLPVQHRPEVGYLFRQAYEAFHHERQQSPLEVKGCMMQLLGVLLEEIRRPTATAVSRAGQDIARVRDVIECAYQTDLTLAQLAEQAGVSRGYLCAAFTRQYGCSPIEYLLSVRIRKAQRLLATGMMIKDVAEEVGCHSQHYFSRLFRQRIGMTPREFAIRYGRKT